MVTLGIGRTQTLVTHVGRWCGAIFALSGYLYGAGVVQNMAIFGVKIRHLWRAGFQGEDPTWKWFYVPYHTPMHGTTLFRAIFALSRHPSRVPGVQKCLFLRSDSGHYGRLSPGHIVPPGKCLVRHITPQCMEQHYLGSLLPSPGTYPGLQGSKNGYFRGCLLYTSPSPRDRTRSRMPSSA